uniref:Marginal zone B and B1 cell specific protein n=1 Tax=Vombatus ursinus TaxID=29139 RepID=A0A4X2M002_VOMUR
MRFLLLLLPLTGWGPLGSLGEGIPQETITATSPHFDEEEKYSTHMPQHLRCDACQIISYQVRILPTPPPDRHSSSGSPEPTPRTKVWGNRAM